MQRLVLPKCPNCKKLYKFFASDDEDFDYLMKHEDTSPSCPFGLLAYDNDRAKCVEAVREHFKANFPWKYKDAKARLS